MLAVTNNLYPILMLSHIAYLCNVLWLLVTANIVPSSPILVTLMMEPICSSETLILITATWRNIHENILHSHYRENLESYNSFIVQHLSV
jgi:hypothetical protein